MQTIDKKDIEGSTRALDNTGRNPFFVSITNFVFSNEGTEFIIHITYIQMGVCSMFFPKVWDLVDEFKERCKLKGWKAYDKYDVIKADNKYCEFIWVRNIQPASFKTIIIDAACSVQEGLSYRMIKLSHMIWLLIETPATSIWRIVKETPDLTRKVSVYDLSEAYKGRLTCPRLNETTCAVLQEFEHFINTKYDVEFTSYSVSRSYPRPEGDPSDAKKTLEGRDVGSEGRREIKVSLENTH